MLTWTNIDWRYISGGIDKATHGLSYSFQFLASVYWGGVRGGGSSCVKLISTKISMIRKIIRWLTIALALGQPVVKSLLN